MLECHVSDFIREWGAGLGFYGEQGGESIHKEFNAILPTCAHIKPATEKLRSALKKFILKSYPEVIDRQPEVVTRGPYNKKKKID